MIITPSPLEISFDSSYRTYSQIVTNQILNNTFDENNNVTSGLILTNSNGDKIAAKNLVTVSNMHNGKYGYGSLPTGTTYETTTNVVGSTYIVKITLSKEEEKREKADISGTVENIIYSNEQNGYTVCEIDTGDPLPVTAVGIMPYLAEGEIIRVMGTWTTHATFGKQFKVECYEKELPVTAAAILKYLSAKGQSKNKS